jgi:hypothetical protein
LAVVVLPRALQERLIGGVLDQGVLENVPGPRRPPPLIEQFGWSLESRVA